MRKVYINNCPFYFVTESVSFPEMDGHMVFQYNSRADLEYLISFVEAHGQLKKVEITHKDPETAFRIFSSFFTPVEAAGGIVKNPLGQSLMIFRHEKWDLPKGKLEKNESPESGAIREVEEECGVAGLQMMRPITTTLHAYLQDNKRFLKRTHWYEMFTSFEGVPVPQTEENITKAEWKNAPDVKKALENSYPTIIEVFGSM